MCPAHHRAVHEGGWNVEADGRERFTFLDPHGHVVPEVVLSPATDVEAVLAAASAAGVVITDRTIESRAGGERMDLDWTMTVVCGDRRVDPIRVRTCSAEHSDPSADGDDWTVEVPPLDPEDEVLLDRFRVSPSMATD